MFVCVTGELESVPPPPGMTLNRLGEDFPAARGQRHDKCLISFLSHLKNIENGLLALSLLHDSALPESAGRFDLFISAWALAAVKAAGSSTAFLCFLVSLFSSFAEIYGFRLAADEWIFFVCSSTYLVGTATDGCTSLGLQVAEREGVGGCRPGARTAEGGNILQSNALFISSANNSSASTVSTTTAGTSPIAFLSRP